MNKKEISVQQWIPIQSFLENGVLKLKDNKYVKVMTVKPINFNLKSELEKNAILNSYKIFLKTCDFNFQILIQSNKENLSKNISNIENNLKRKEESFLKEISEEYIKYIKSINSGQKSSAKNFYIIIINEENQNGNEEIIIEELNEKFLKIKECLSRCGNIVLSISSREELIQIIYSFLNSKKYLSNK